MRNDSNPDQVRVFDVMQNCRVIERERERERGDLVCVMCIIISYPLKIYLWLGENSYVASGNGEMLYLLR